MKYDESYSLRWQVFTVAERTEIKFAYFEAWKSYENNKYILPGWLDTFIPRDRKTYPLKNTSRIKLSTHQQTNPA